MTDLPVRVAVVVGLLHQTGHAPERETHSPRLPHVFPLSSGSGIESSRLSAVYERVHLRALIACAGLVRYQLLDVKISSPRKPFPSGDRARPARAPRARSWSSRCSGAL